MWSQILKKISDKGCKIAAQFFLFCLANFSLLAGFFFVFGAGKIFCDLHIEYKFRGFIFKSEEKTTLAVLFWVKRD